MPVCPVLVGFGDGEGLGFLIEAADEGDAGGSALVGEAVGHDHRRVPGEVGDLHRAAAEAGRDEDVDILHQTGHIGYELRADAIGVDVLDGGNQAGGAEDIGPGAVILTRHAIDRAIARDLVEGGGGFGGENGPEPADIRGRQFDGHEFKAGVAHDIEHGGAVDLVDALQRLALLAMMGAGLAGISRFEGISHVADAQAMRIKRRIPGEGRGRERHVAAIGAVDGAEDQRAIFDRARHRPDLVHAPAEGHGAVAADAAEGGAQAADAAAGAGRDDGTHGLGADGEADQAGGHRCARAG